MEHFECFFVYKATFYGVFKNIYTNMRSILSKIVNDFFSTNNYILLNKKITRILLLLNVNFRKSDLSVTIEKFVIIHGHTRAMPLVDAIIIYYLFQHASNVCFIVIFINCLQFFFSFCKAGRTKQVQFVASDGRIRGKRSSIHIITRLKTTG